MQVTSIALGGLQQAENQLNRTASLLARSTFSSSGTPDAVSLSDLAVSLLQAKVGFDANLDSLKVAGEMQKSALNLGA